MPLFLALPFFWLWLCCAVSKVKVQFPLLRDLSSNAVSTFSLALLVRSYLHGNVPISSLQELTVLKPCKFLQAKVFPDLLS